MWSKRGRSQQASGSWRVSPPSLTLWPSCHTSSDTFNRLARWKRVARVWRPTSCSFQSTPRRISSLTLPRSCPQPSPVASPSSGRCLLAGRVRPTSHWLLSLVCSKGLWMWSSVPRRPLRMTAMAHTSCGSLFQPAGRQSSPTPLPTPPTSSYPSSPRLLQRLPLVMITGASSRCGSPRMVYQRLAPWTRGRRYPSCLPRSSPMYWGRQTPCSSRWGSRWPLPHNCVPTCSCVAFPSGGCLASWRHWIVSCSPHPSRASSGKGSGTLPFSAAAWRPR